MSTPVLSAVEGLRPLEGVRVFELSIAIAGPTCGRYLAHFGAEVIKVESVRNPDVIRYLGPAWKSAEEIGAQAWSDLGVAASEFMAGKRSVGLDLKMPEGTEAARRLLAKCDVFISNYCAPAIAKLGFDYESVRAVKPDIVYAAITGFGTSPESPYYDFVAWGPNQAPLVGLDDLTGWADRAPTGFVNIALPDYSNGLHATVAVLAALDHRSRTGEGQAIDLAQLEATAALVGPWLVGNEVGVAGPTRDGNRVPSAAPHGIYRCRGEERWIAIGVFEEEEWLALGRVAGHPEWAEDPRFRTLEARLSNPDALDRAIEAWTGEHSDDELAEWLQGAGVAAVPVQNAPRVAADPQLAARDFWILADHLRLGKDLVTGNPIHLEETPGSVGRASPSLGEDNEAVLAGICGYDEAEIRALVEKGAVFPLAAPDLRLERPAHRWIRHWMPQLPWPGEKA